MNKLILKYGGLPGMSFRNSMGTAMHLRLVVPFLAVTLCFSACKRDKAEQPEEISAQEAQKDGSVSAFVTNGVSVASATAYSTASGSTTIGSIDINENLRIGSVSGSRTSVTYHTTGADKTGWVASSAVKLTSWMWPVEAVRTTQDFNNYSTSRNGYHLAIDMTSLLDNDNISATFGGTIKYAGYSSGNGNHVIIEHTNGSGAKLYSLYCHMISFGTGISTGNSIAKGAKIGVMGCTGSCTGKHLHFALYKTNYSTNPYGYTSSGGTLISRTDNKIVMDYSTHYNPEYVIRNNGATP
ncbi:MAG TPA: M23 family metallopeptidase [Sphingobacteriaceae bacterium]|nr:M23 family metallopeptidase [Sphingobacteriaceae bacterium]